MLGFSKKTPLYTGFTVTGDTPETLRARFTAGSYVSKEFTAAELVELGMTFNRRARNADEKILFAHALAVLYKREEDLTVAQKLAVEKKAAEDRAARIKGALIRDEMDLPRPLRPPRNDLLFQRPAIYDGFSLTDHDPANPQADIGLKKPYMDILDNGTYGLCCSTRMSERRLLSEFRSNVTMNFEDQLLIHRALIALRAHKIENDIETVPLRAPEKAPPPPPAPSYDRRSRATGGLMIFL